MLPWSIICILLKTRIKIVPLHLEARTTFERGLDDGLWSTSQAHLDGRLAIFLDEGFEKFGEFQRISFVLVQTIHKDANIFPPKMKCVAQGNSESIFGPLKADRGGTRHWRTILVQACFKFR